MFDYRIWNAPIIEHNAYFCFYSDHMYNMQVHMKDLFRQFVFTGNNHYVHTSKKVWYKKVHQEKWIVSYGQPSDHLLSLNVSTLVSRCTNFTIEVEKVCMLVISLLALLQFNSISHEWVGIGGRDLTFHLIRHFSDYKTWKMYFYISKLSYSH